MQYCYVIIFSFEAVEQRILSTCSYVITIVLIKGPVCLMLSGIWKEVSILKHFVVYPLFHHLCSYCYMCTTP